MAGRGRGLTLPAWMTAAERASAPPPAAAAAPARGPAARAIGGPPPGGAVCGSAGMDGREREREREREFRGGGGGGQGEEPARPPPPPDPEYGLSGALADETNTTRDGVVLRYNEPAEAAPPGAGGRWRLYVFKNGEPLQSVNAAGAETGVAPPLLVHRQSAYLFGRDRTVVDIPVDHPSCSKQHAVLQYRKVEVANEEDESAPPVFVVRPYLIDLNSTNGTFLNQERIDAQRYYELREKDCVRFGSSSREYVVLKEDTTD